MTVREIVTKVAALNLPEGSYIVFGSCPLAAVGIRESQDIDLLISPELDAALYKKGWQRIEKAGDDKQLAYGDFDTHTTWRIGAYDPTLAQLLQTALIIDGVPFGALEEVRKWKTELRRSKDLADIQLIDAYLGTVAK